MNKVLKTIWNLLKIAMGVCVICSTFYFGYNYLSSKFRNPDAYYNDSFHNLPEDSMDVIVLGSSHAQYSFSPTFFYEDTGLYSYTLGSACQPLEVSYQMLREALKTQSPKLVILETYTATPLRSACEADSCYVTAEYQMRGMEKINTINYLPEEKAASYRNDFMNYHNDWRTKESFDFLFEEDDKSIDQSFGYIPLESDYRYDNWWHNSVFNDKSSDVELDKLDLESLNNILNLCRENDIELLMYFVPMDMLDELNQKYRYKVWNFCDENNVKYVDFANLSNELDYRIPIHNDGFHSRVTGASITTSYLANFIKENGYEFNHSNNGSLNGLYNYYIDYYSYALLNGEHNPDKYLNRIVRYPYLKLVRYQGTMLNRRLKDVFNDMGLLDLNEGENYYAIIYGNDILACDKHPISYDLDGHHIELNYDGAYFDGEEISSGNDLSMAIFYKDYSSKAVKTMSYSNGLLWDTYYDFDYNHK
ncbi:MAG: hypothetical protein PT938_03480 [Solobacterium sp.]|nr:hypothetical protein [Solobacterium sp.]MDD7775818.1 hypothetical protein [Solobacterium sp.]MDY2953454.1 hypothetical protein [Erysipelotrichaceae bacterium]